QVHVSASLLEHVNLRHRLLSRVFWLERGVDFWVLAGRDRAFVLQHGERSRTAAWSAETQDRVLGSSACPRWPAEVKRDLQRAVEVDNRGIARLAAKLEHTVCVQ